MIRQLLAILGLQLAVAAVVVAGFGAASGVRAATSAAAGGLIAVVPGGFYVWRVIRARNAPAQKLMSVHFAAEMGKLGLTVLLFGATFAWFRDVAVVPLFIAYIATLLVYWAALMMFDRV